MQMMSSCVTTHDHLSIPTVEVFPHKGRRLYSHWEAETLERESREIESTTGTR
jgi:hypothetical protein